MNPPNRNESNHSLAKRGLIALTLSAIAVTARADYPSQILSDGPLLYFRLNENITLPTFDTGTNRGTLGTGANGLYTTVTHGIGGIPGASGNSAINLPGSGNMQVPYNAALNQAGAFTAEFWTRPGGGSSCPFNSVDFGAAQRTGWLIYQDTIIAGNWTFRVYKTGGANTQISGGTVTQGAWHHVVGVFDSNTNLSLYVDGVLAAGPTPLGADQTPMANPAIPLSLGIRSDAAFQYTGDLDEVVYYTNALTAAQILAHYTAGTNSATANYSTQILGLNPAGYWRLDEAAAPYPTAANASSLGAAANGSYISGVTNSSGPQPAAFPGFEANNSAAALDGASGFVRIPKSGNLTGTSLTSVNQASFVCWVKRNGAQGEYKGLLAMRPASNGLYLNNDDTLNYSWNDDSSTWGFDSGLIPPDGEWTLAAIVVEPTQATFYMQSISGGFTNVVNPVTHGAADFTSGPFAIGRDINFGGAGRFFNGAIDEAAVFTSALNEGRFRSYFLTAINDNHPPVLLSDPPTVSPAGTIYATTTFSIAVNASAASPAFQWRKGGTPISGATTATYTKSNASAGDDGNYDVVVTNNFGSLTSSIVSISINPAIPPVISQQPVSRSVYAGGSGFFSVGATGTTPLSYQWKHATTNLPGATGTSLVISSVDASKTGNYSVNVSNVAGNVDSTTVSLTIRAPAAGSFEAAVVGNGPIGYWRLGETNGTTAFDLAGGHDGTYNGGVTHVAGGLNGDSDGAANFNGTDAYVGTGSGLLNGLIQYTLTGWVRRGGAQANRTGLYGQNDNIEFGYISDQDIQCWDNVLATAVDAANPLADGVWGMITVTGNGTNRVIYINGQPAVTGASRSSSLTNNFGFNIGGGGVFDATGNWFLGDIDEVAIFDKALTADQVNNLYLVGAFGTTTPPFFVQQPLSRTDAAGGTATFSVMAGGSVPLSYQWMKNGTPILGATTATLSLANVYYTDNGSYSVTVTNNVGKTNSASATLTVFPVPTFANQTNGLVLHLKFDGNYGDSSGRSNHATPGNAPVFVPGKIGSQAVQVNTDFGAAIYNYVEALNTNTGAPYPDLQFTAADSFTVAYWAKYTGTPNDLPIICNAMNSTYQPGWVFSDDGGKLEWTLTSVTPDTGQVVADPVPGSPTINDGTWHHTLVAFNRSSGRAESFVDGVLVDARSIATIGNLDTGSGVFIGQDPTGAYGFTGLAATYDIDDLGIWRRALNGYEALSIYNAGQNSQESFDVYGPVKVYVNRIGLNIDISWQAGTLLQATNVPGPYSPVAGATVPFYRTTASGSARFFRVQQ